MPDVYATIAEADQELQERLARVLELRAADPQQRAMLEDYSARLELPGAAELLEVGCGTGAISRFLATLPGVAGVTGVDPSPLFVERARELAGDAPLAFATGDGRELEFDDAGSVHPFDGWTDLVVTPERGVRAVDGLLTGWHEPEASHLDLLEAVAGRELVERSYDAALSEGYLWHEFGDVHLILP